MDLCDAPADQAAAILAFQVDAPSTLAMVNLGRPFNRRPPIWSLREGCADETLICGRRFREELSPLLLPGRIYHLLAWDPDPIESSDQNGNQGNNGNGNGKGKGKGLSRRPGKVAYGSVPLIRDNDGSVDYLFEKLLESAHAEAVEQGTSAAKDSL